MADLKELLERAAAGAPEEAHTPRDVVRAAQRDQRRRTTLLAAAAMAAVVGVSGVTWALVDRDGTQTQHIEPAAPEPVRVSLAAARDAVAGQDYELVRTVDGKDPELGGGSLVDIEDDGTLVFRAPDSDDEVIRLTLDGSASTERVEQPQSTSPALSQAWVDWRVEHPLVLSNSGGTLDQIDDTSLLPGYGEVSEQASDPTVRGTEVHDGRMFLDLQRIDVGAPPESVQQFAVYSVALDDAEDIRRESAWATTAETDEGVSAWVVDDELWVRSPDGTDHRAAVPAECTFAHDIAMEQGRVAVIGGCPTEIHAFVLDGHGQVLSDVSVGDQRINGGTWLESGRLVLATRTGQMFVHRVGSPEMLSVKLRPPNGFVRVGGDYLADLDLKSQQIVEARLLP